MIAKKSAPGVSVDTQRPSVAKTKSILIRQCSCGVRFEVRGEFQSLIKCPECRQTKRCVHGVTTIERCVKCYQQHGSWFMRTM